jgi:hypothetical protein
MNQPDDSVLGLPGEICEICQERVGVMNSRFELDGEWEGLWTCLLCEQDVETEHYEVAQ